MNKCVLFVNNIEIGDNIKIADTFFTRLNGLMFKKTLEKNEGLIINPCNSIHMCFMNFPLDILFITKDNVICDFIENIKPWKISKIYFNAEYVIELPAGTIKAKNIKKNQKISTKTIDK